MGSGKPLFEPASDVDIDILLARLTAIRAGYLDELAAANIPSDIDEILADTDMLETWWQDGGRLDQLIDAIKIKTDILPSANTDESGNFTWVTATHTTNEGDISDLFTTDLTGFLRRRYTVFIDLTGPEADVAAWTKCTVRVKVGFGVGSAYRTVDKKEIAKADVAAGEEPGINIDIPAVTKNVQITLQFDVALNANATIYYSYVREALEVS